jgi:hypothetical protein
MAFRYVHIRPNLPLAIRAVEGVRSTPIWSPPVTSLARRSDLARRARAASKRISFWRSCVEMKDSCLYEPTSRKSSTLTGQSTRPGEDSTGAGAEREWDFDPQSKAEVAQGEYKGAREVLARHGHTAQPWGWPGGVLRTQRTTQPSWMCSFDDI